MGGCSSSERPQEVAHDVLLNYGSKSGFKWKQMEELMEERIVGLDI